MSPRPRDEPVSLGDALAEVGRDLGLADPATLTAFLEAWPELVGDDIARHARVRSVRAGLCTVAVDDPAYATQLRYLANDVLRAARERLGRGAPDALRVVVEPPRKDRSRHTGPVY
jgi:predicted nucleic acid-binding Zn ribbon protein